MTGTEKTLVTPYSLGASLYVPSTRNGLEDIANGLRWPDLRSMIFCTEDAIRPEDTELGIRRLRAMLRHLDPSAGPHRFIRARNPEVLKRLLDLPHIERIDGVVLPKIDTRSFEAWARAAAGYRGRLMLTLETPEAFDQAALVRLRGMMDGWGLRDNILCLRIGGNDLLSLLAARRPRGKTLYSGPLGWAIAQLAGIFVPNGYALSAPVFEALDDPATLQEEVALDLEHGLVGKTAIHPRQVPVIHELYRVRDDDLAEAERILAPSAPAVFQSRGTMCEPATHRRWADSIRQRAKVFGVRRTIDEMPLRHDTPAFPAVQAGAGGWLPPPDGTKPGSAASG